jgi:hypothetical protein
MNIIHKQASCHKCDGEVDTNDVCKRCVVRIKEEELQN